MDYRHFGRSGLDVSAVSLGTEYLIDLPQDHVSRVIRHAVERGINYFDLFYAQARFRDVMGVAFAGLRDQVMISAHLGVHEVDGQNAKTRDLAVSEDYFHQYLRRLRTEYVDVLFVHNIDPQEDYDWAMAHLLPQAQALRNQGKARLIGFSGHTVSTSLQAVETGEIDVLMFPVNLAGHALAGMPDLLRACQERGVALVAMKPFAGGRLLRPETAVVIKNHHRGGGREGDDTYVVEEKSAITPVQCLAYTLSRIGVSCALPGCKSMEEVDAALAVLAVGPEEKDFSDILPTVSEYAEGECVYCNHCQPCPSQIDIGLTLRLLDEVRGQPSPAQAAAYAALPAPASDCIECGACTDRCPFRVETMDRIAQAAALFEA
jgi:predicted aldo/keto reductase-like oxidoreductase